MYSLYNKNDILYIIRSLGRKGEDTSLAIFFFAVKHLLLYSSISNR